MNSTFNLRNFLTENKLTRVSKLIKEEKTTTYTISDDMANSFGMNMEEFEETLQQRYGFKNYEEDVDYEWHFGRGDDFPNAVTILNKDMESDRRIQRFLEEIEGTVNLEERLGDEEENQNKKLRKEEVNYNSDAWVQAQRDEMGLDDEEIEENSFRVLDLPDGDYFAIDMNWDDEYKGKKGLFFTINGNDISGKDGSMETSPREFLSQFKPQEILKVEDSLEELENPLNEAPGFRQKINFDDIRPGSKLSNKFRSGKTYIVLSSDNKSATVKNVATGYVMTLYSLANYSLD